MFDKRMLDLQMFADDDDGEETEELLDEEEFEQGDEDDQPEEEPKKLVMTQQEFDERINQLTARERTRSEKKLAKIFGTTDLNTAGEYYKAGYAVSQAAKKPPAEILQRLRGQQQQQVPGQQQAADDGLRQELNEIKSVLFDQREQSVREKEETEARKEFGNLYNKYQDDIEDKAEERGLSLVDAAAIVLRPHLREVVETQTRERQQNKRKRRVDSTDGAPPKGTDPAATLNSAQKRTAQKMGISLKDYYTQLKELGRIE